MSHKTNSNVELKCGDIVTFSSGETPYIAVVSKLLPAKVKCVFLWRPGQKHPSEYTRFPDRMLISSKEVFFANGYSQDDLDILLALVQ